MKNPNRTLWLFLLLAAALFLPAYLINLDMVQLIRDEAIRAIVAFEMLQSGDFVTPTISGELYLNKPPVFNWIIAFFFWITGSYSETVIRLPVIVSIVFFALTIFYFTRKEFGPHIALINALAFVTYGRIIFYESLHGLIDVTFSWLTYSFFMLSWHFFQKKKFFLLFMVAYAITAISYLLKGMPSLYFTAASLLVLFIQGKNFRMLLNWRHFAGIFLLILIVGGYYLLYFTRNTIEPGQVLDVLTGEVTRRTVVRFGIWNTFLHLLTYPFENIYHFLPWSLLVIVLFRKDSIRRIRQNPFLWYCLLLFIVNIIPYWTSPEAYARYILMLIPLIMTVFLALYFAYRKEGLRIVRWVDAILGAMIGVGIVSGIIFMLHPETKHLPYIIWVSLLLTLSLGIVLFFYRKQAYHRFLWLAIGLLIFRLAFNFSIIPSWERSHPAVPTRSMAIELAEQTADKPLMIYWNPYFQPDRYFHYRYNNEIFTYYLSTAREEIIRIGQKPIPGIYFIAQWEHIKHEDFKVIRELDPVWQTPVLLIEFNQ